MLQWTLLKLPGAVQRIQEIKKSTMSEVVNPSIEDNIKEVKSHPFNEEPEKTINRPIIRPRQMLDKMEDGDKIVPVQCSDDSVDQINDSDVKKTNILTESQNVYIVPPDIFSEFTRNDTVDPEDAQRVIDSPNFKEFDQKVKNKREDFENVTLNIAVTGMTGAGKSSFVNALRGLRNDDDGASPTGAVETTMERKMYPHPTMPNVKIWDLPGIGSVKFKAKTYLKDVELNTYDFFLIVTSERFKEADIDLAKAIRKNKKLFYFIRSKIDNDINAEAKKKDFDKERLLNKIRGDCKKNLKNVGDPEVFLLSSFAIEKYDFQKLISTLEKELPENKKNALMLSLPVYSIENLTKKKTYFKKIIWLNAFAAGSVAILPLPGLALLCDYKIIKDFFEKVYKGFGLTTKALESLSERVNKPVEELIAAKTSRFKDEATDSVVMEMLSKPAIAIAETLGTVLALLPGGALPAGGVAVATIHYLLNKGLDEMAEDTKNILVVAELA